MSIRGGFIVLLAALLVTGCENAAKKTANRLNSQNLTVQDAIAHAGGMTPWLAEKKVTGTALATIFEPDGSETLLRQKYEVTFSPVLSATSKSHEARGILVEQWSFPSGSEIYQDQNNDKLNEYNPRQLYAAALKLRLLTQAVVGPAGLLADDVVIEKVGPERKGGRLTHRVDAKMVVSAGEADKKAVSNVNMTVWLNAETLLPERYWIRYPRLDGTGNGYLAVNASDYRKLDNGAIVPYILELLVSDEYQQFSEKRILSVEFQELKVAEAEKKFRGKGK